MSISTAMNIFNEMAQAWIVFLTSFRIGQGSINLKGFFKFRKVGRLGHIDMNTYNVIFPNIDDIFVEEMKEYLTFCLNTQRRFRVEPFDNRTVLKELASSYLSSYSAV